MATLNERTRFRRGRPGVLLADGTIEPFEDIEVGDMVLAEDRETGKRGPREVTQLWIHEDELIDLVAAGGERVVTTENHAYWNATDGACVAARGRA